MSSTNNMSHRSLNDNYRELMGFIPSAFQGRRRKNDDEIAQLIASLLYLRKENSLRILKETNVNEKTEYVIFNTGHAQYYAQVNGICLCCDRAVLDGITSKEFKKLLLYTLDAFKAANAQEFVLEFVDELNALEFKDGELLAVLDRFMTDMDGMSKGIFCQPNELSQIVSCLIDKKAKKVFDPFGGLMDFATTMPDKQFVAYEINVTTRNLALFRLAIAGILENTALYENSAEYWTNDKFDAIVTFPPFGYRLDVRDRILGIQTDADLAVLSRFEQTTNEEGQLAIIVPLSTLFKDAPPIRRCRETITKNNWLDAVVVLPNNIFQSTQIASALVVLKKKRSKDKAIRFVNASNCVHNNDVSNVIDVDEAIRLILNPDGEQSIDITIDEVLENESSWLVGWYLYLRNAKYREGYQVIPFSNVLVRAHAVDNFSESNGRLVTSEALSRSSLIRSKFKPEDFASSNNLRNARKITEPVLLISLYGVTFPMFCEASESSPLYLRPNIAAYSICNDVMDTGYLSAEIYNRLESLNHFVPLRSCGRLIEKIWLAVPSIDEQKNVYESMKRIDQEAKIRELDLHIDDLIAESKKQFRARKHSLMQNSVSLATNWEDLKDYLITNEGRFDENDTIGVLNPVRIGEIMKAISENIKIMENKIYHLTDEDVDWGEVEGIVLQDFIMDYIAKHQTARYRFDFEPKEKVEMEGYDQNGSVCYLEEPDWKVLMSRKALQQVFDNIVSNARDHGFEDGDNSNNVIKVDYFYSFNCIVLEISNNGKALAEGVDTEFVTTYGSSTKLNDKNRDGKSVHEGQGGSEIDGILKQYNAKVEILSNPDAIFTVTYRIVFNNIEDTIVGFDLGW